MSILISGMEMPHDEAVALYIYPDGRAKLWRPQAAVSHEFEAVHIPPHGRLGDLDDFAKRMKNLVEKAENDGFDLGAAWYSAFVRHIELAPTIVPAEEE